MIYSFIAEVTLPIPYLGVTIRYSIVEKSKNVFLKF
jgi:hypothetical protein